jgi:sugar phosphate isomerase/epimerase
MKTVVETHFIKKHFSEAETYKQIKQAGFDAADLSFYYGSIKLDENYLAAAKETRRLLDEVGLPCVQAHAQFYSDQNPGFQYGMNMDVSEPAFLELTRAIEYAAIAGAKNIVCHSITVPEGGQTGACLEYNYKFFKALAPYAKQFGIKLAIENLYATFTTPFALSELLRRLDDPEVFCACIDVGHSNLCRVHPQDFLRDMLPGSVQALHIHDNYGSVDNHLLPGHGRLDWEEITKALADIDYQGDFTLEAVSFWKAFDADLMPDAIALAAKVARKLVDKIESYRNA